MTTNDTTIVKITGAISTLIGIVSSILSNPGTLTKTP